MTNQLTFLLTDKLAIQYPLNQNIFFESYFFCIYRWDKISSQLKGLMIEYFRCVAVGSFLSVFKYFLLFRNVRFVFRDSCLKTYVSFFFFSYSSSDLFPATSEIRGPLMDAKKSISYNYTFELCMHACIITKLGSTS